MDQSSMNKVSQMKDCLFFKAYSAELPDLKIMCVKRSWRPQPDRRRYSNPDVSEDENEMFEPKVFSPIRKDKSLESYLGNIENVKIRDEMQEHQRLRQLGYKIADELFKPVQYKNVSICPSTNITPTRLHEDEESSGDRSHEAGTVILFT
jgi:hypothetical protein